MQRIYVKLQLSQKFIVTVTLKSYFTLLFFHEVWRLGPMKVCFGPLLPVFICYNTNYEHIYLFYCFRPFSFIQFESLFNRSLLWVFSSKKNVSGNQECLTGDNAACISSCSSLPEGFIELANVRDGPVPWPRLINGTGGRPTLDGEMTQIHEVREKGCGERRTGKSQVRGVKEGKWMREKYWKTISL